MEPPLSDRSVSARIRQMDVSTPAAATDDPRCRPDQSGQRGSNPGRTLDFSNIPPGLLDVGKSLRQVFNESSPSKGSSRDQSISRGIRPEEGRAIPSSSEGSADPPSEKAQH